METETTLLLAARRMDKDALAKIFDLYSSPLYKYSLRLGSDPALADQLVGDVFAKLLEQLALGNGPTCNLRAYLYEMAYHRVVDEARDAKRKAPLEVMDWHPALPDSGSLHVEEKHLFEQVVHAVQHDLTADQRHVIILRFLEELSLRETAAILGKPVSHVKVIQGRALAKLRKSLEEKNHRKTMSSWKFRLPKIIRA